MLVENLLGQGRKQTLEAILRDSKRNEHFRLERYTLERFPQI